MTTPPHSVRPSVSRIAARLDVLGRRAAGRVGDAVSQVARGTRSALGFVTLPPAVWDASTDADRLRFDVCASAGTLPLPAAAALVRALTGRRHPSLDAWNPLGPRRPEAPGVLLLPVGALCPGAWALDGALRTLTPRISSTTGADLHTVVLARPADAEQVVRRLRSHHGRRLPGILLVSDAASDTGPVPDRRRFAAALGLVDAVLVPHPELLDPAVARLAAAAGRPVVGPGREREPCSTLGDAGRSARLRLVQKQAEMRTADRLPRASTEVTRESRRVVLAGHDLKFAHGLQAELIARGHEVRVDPWAGHARHDLDLSRSLARWADVVHCEWSLGNAVWYSRAIPSETRLTTRTHLQEAATEFPGRVRGRSVDAWVFVAEHVRAQVLRDTGFPAARSHWVPNGVKIPPHRPHGHEDDSAERRFTLGLVGVLPERKGLHRALDVVAELRFQDPRYSLRVRGHRPDEVAWMSSRPEAAAYYAAQERRLKEDPVLRGAVTWDPHGPDMGAWYSRVGVALSVSDFESFHFTLPDGAVHGAVPRSLAWAGADRLYPAHWLAADLDELAASVRAVTADARRWREAAGEAHDFVAGHYAADRVTPVLADVVLGVR